MPILTEWARMGEKGYSVSTGIIEGAARRDFSLLLDRAFEVPVGRHFLEDFPIWDPQLVPGGESLLRLGAFLSRRGPGSAGTLVASTGARIAWLRTRGPARLKVALIGAVATEPAYRGHGLASSLVESALSWACRRGIAAAFLWGAEHSLYERLGFELCGTQATIPLAGLQLEEGEPGAVREGWTPAIFEALATRNGGLALQPEDRLWVEAQQKSVRWYWLGPAEDPRAYAALGRGIDLTGMVHEWGGEAEALRRLLSGIRTLHPDAVLLGSPALFERAGIRGRGDRTEFLCLGRVLDLEALLAAYDLSMAARARIEDARGQGAARICRFLFGPDPDPDPDPGSGVPAGCLELPLWFWGLDAV